MRCNNCGSEIENGSIFCAYCGSRVVNDSVNAQQPVGNMQQPVSNIQQPVSNMQNNGIYMGRMPVTHNNANVKTTQNSKDNKALLTILVVFVFLLVVGTVCIIGYRIFSDFSVQHVGVFEDITSEPDESENYELAKDLSFSGMDENMISEDLIAWLNATYAIQTEANGLDSTVIGGMEPGDSNIKAIKNSLKAGWGIKNKEDLVQKVGKLVADDGDSNNDGWDYSRAEELLAHGYCVGWFDLGEYLGYAVPIAKDIQKRYSSWDAFGDNYIANYMSWVANGGMGFAGDINLRSTIHQMFVTGREYYYGPYAVDFDMELKADAIARYYDSMNSDKKIPAATEKVPEFIKGYIAPTQLGEKATSGIIQIDGDLYQMPAPVKAFTDNGWELESWLDNATFSSTEQTHVAMKRNGKRLVLFANVLSVCSGDVDNAYVERIDIVPDSDIRYVLPGAIRIYGKKEDVVKALRKGNSGEIKEGKNSIEISLAGRGEQNTTNKIVICFDDKDKVSAINYNCTNTYADTAESIVRVDIFNVKQNIEDAKKRKSYLESKFGG